MRNCGPATRPKRRCCARDRSSPRGVVVIQRVGFDLANLHVTEAGVGQHRRGQLPAPHRAEPAPSSPSDTPMQCIVETVYSAPAPARVPASCPPGLHHHADDRAGRLAARPPKQTFWGAVSPVLDSVASPGRGGDDKSRAPQGRRPRRCGAVRLRRPLRHRTPRRHHRLRRRPDRLHPDPDASTRSTAGAASAGNRVCERRRRGRLKGRQPEAVGHAARRAAPHAQNRQLHDHRPPELFRVSRPTVYRTLAAAEHVAAQGN
jgi:hypothetical protein